MKKLMFALSLLAVGVAEAGPLAEKIAAKHTIKRQDIWAGGERTVFDFDGCEAWVVEPPAGVKPLEGVPWTWTMQWFEAYLPRTAVPRLLAQGYHHVTLDVFKWRACDSELHRFADFQKFLVEDLGFAPKARLIGMSWGGFFSVRYASTYPQNVDRIFLDCPLMNFDLFGKGKGEGPWVDDPPPDGNWTTDPRMPINRAVPIAKAGIPILLRYGGQDQTVLPKYNCELFIPRFKAAGGKIEVVHDGYYGHHPHGFEVDSPDIIEFFAPKCVSVRTPNISVFADFIRKVAKERKVTLAKAAEMLYDLGVRGFDCGPNEKDLGELCATKLKPINFYYAPHWLEKQEGWFDKATPAECLDLAKRLGIPRIMVVPPDFTGGKENAAEFDLVLARMKDFVAEAKKDGITITVEDFGGTANPCSYTKYLKRFLDEIPDIRFALDSGNLYYAGRGENILDMMAYAKGRIAHVHLKDQTKSDNRSYATLGTGAVPNEAVVKQTWADGYDGWYTLENPVGDTYQDTERQMAVLKAWIAGK